MPLITELFAFVVIDDGGPDDEGIPAFRGPGAWIPLMGADTARVESLMEKAQEVANATGMPMKIYRFTGREQIGEVNPQPKAVPDV